MMCRSYLAFLLFAAAVVVPRDSLAQFSIDAVFGASFDRIGRGTVESATAPAGTFAVDHLTSDEKLRLSYSFDGGTFSSDGNWSYLQHDGGGRYRVSLGPAGMLFVGGSATVRTNGSSWASTDFRGLGAFANLEHTVGRGMLRLGVRTDRRIFTDERQLDHLETTTFGSASASFATRTTVIGEVGIGWKRYDEAAQWTSVSDFPAGDTEVVLGAASGGQAQGWMGGGNGAGAPGQQGGGALRDTAPRWQRPVVIAPPESTGPMVPRRVTVFGRVAQSLGDRIGLSLEASHRTVSGAVATAVVTTPEMLIDDGVYDDPYASDETVWRVGLKRVFAVGRDIGVGVSHWDKLYRATPALDSQGSPLPGVLRDDRVWRFEAAWREPIAASRTGRIELAAITGYTFMDSESTDGYYTYASHRLQVMLALAY